VIVLGNRDHAEMRHALLWEVMDNSEGDKRRDWNQDIFDLYEARADENEQRWADTQKKRLKHTKPSLKSAAYAGRYRSEMMGDIQVEKSGRKMSLKTTLVEFEMSHWHLDTYLVEYKSWQMHEFATFNIGPDGTVISVTLFGDTFRRVDEK